MTNLLDGGPDGFVVVITEGRQVRDKFGRLAGGESFPVDAIKERVAL